MNNNLKSQLIRASNNLGMYKKKLRQYQDEISKSQILNNSILTDHSKPQKVLNFDTSKESYDLKKIHPEAEKENQETTCDDLSSFNSSFSEKPL